LALLSVFFGGGRKSVGTDICAVIVYTAKEYGAKMGFS